MVFILPPAVARREGRFLRLLFKKKVMIDDRYLYDRIVHEETEKAGFKVLTDEDGRFYFPLWVDKAVRDKIRDRILSRLEVELFGKVPFPEGKVDEEVNGSGKYKEY